MKKASIYRKPMQEGIFEEEFTLEALSAMGNPLEQVSSLVDFELFRPALESVLARMIARLRPGVRQWMSC